VPYAGRLVLVADGAQWLWRLVRDLLPVCTQIVDYYHAKEQLAQLAQRLYPHDADRAQTWLKPMNKALFQGEIWKIIAELENQQLASSYFVHHQRRMQ
jgi:hypothetical protein